MDGELMTILEAMSHVRRFHRSQRCGCQGVNVQDLATMETCNIKIAEKSPSGHFGPEFKPTCPRFQAENGVLSTKDGPFGGD